MIPKDYEPRILQGDNVEQISMLSTTEAEAVFQIIGRIVGGADFHGDIL